VFGGAGQNLCFLLRRAQVWYGAVIMRWAGEKALIHYIGWQSVWNEWFSQDDLIKRTRPLGRWERGLLQVICGCGSGRGGCCRWSLDMGVGPLGLEVR
jgi:hypothetical protein